MCETKNKAMGATCCECKQHISFPEGWDDPNIVPSHKKDGMSSENCSGSGLFSRESLQEEMEKLGGKG